MFGANDGLVSNVSLIIGFAGSGADSSVVRLAGLAGAIAGSISMAAGEWVSVSAQNDLIERELAVERRELIHNPSSETFELADMYEAHGMSRSHALTAAEQVMRQPESALAVHAREELGIDPHDLPTPWLAAALSFVCFLVGALLPVIPWLFDVSGSGPTTASLIIGGVAAGVIGAAIGRRAERNIAWFVARQVLIVMGACAVTYTIGRIVGINVT